MKKLHGLWRILAGLALLIASPGDSADAAQDRLDELDMGEAGYQLASSSTVMVNQLGYPTGAAKIGVVITAMTRPGTIEVVNSSGTVVWTGGSTVVLPADVNSGDAVHHADFSGFTTPGSGYRLRVTLGGSVLESEAFDIDDEVYAKANLAKAAIKYFNWKRSGIAVGGDSEFNIAGHGQSHMGDASLSAYGGWSPAVFDVAGGWYDAGDFGKYMESHTIAIWYLANLFERLAGREDPGGLSIDKLNLGINDSALPDLLDEIAWGTRWVRGAMPYPTAHISNTSFNDLVANKCVGENWSAWVNYDQDADTTRACMGPSSSATHSAARNMAMVSRLLRPYGSTITRVSLGSGNLSAEAYADVLWEAAKEAFGRARGRHPDYADYTGAQASNMMRSDLDMTQSPGFNAGSGAYGDEDMSDDEYAAEVELYLTACQRGDARAVAAYKPLVMSHQYYKAAGPCDWGSERELGDPDAEETGCALVSLLTVHDKACRGDFALPAGDIDDMRRNLFAYADGLIAGMNSQNYPFYAADGGQVVWGSNAAQVGGVVMLSAAYEHSGNQKYLAAAYRFMDYLLGVNPMKTSYVIGFGDAAEQYTHDRAMSATGGWVRGTLVGGPHNVDAYFDALAFRWDGSNNIGDSTTPNSGPALKRYTVTDDGANSWECKENAVNWNAALANAAWSLQLHSRELSCGDDDACNGDQTQPVHGDGVCDADEDCISCPDDSTVCPTCDDGIQNQG
jgi:endoglucanase